MGRHRKDFSNAVELYESGLSLAEVGRTYGVTRQTMWVVLKRRGVAFRPQLRYGETNHFHRGGSLKVKPIMYMVGKAIEQGILAKPALCECCSTVPPVEAHHDDYNQPLAVRWLCKKCHFDWHRTHTAIPMREMVG